jgi:integrase/recombinase XerC
MRYKELFIEYLRFEKRYSRHTILSYENDLSQYLDFAQNTGIQDEIPDAKTIRMWIVEQMETGTTARTIHRKMSTLRSFCKYLMQQGHLRSNPLDKIIKPKLKKRLPEFIEEEKINSFLDKFEFGNDYTGTRNRLIIELLYQTGIRRAELIALKTDSFQPYKNQIRVFGKRNKERIIPVLTSLAELIISYTIIRNKEFPGAEYENLLLTDRGKPVYDKLIYRVVRNFLSMITTKDKKSPHILRHTFATHLLNKGADLNAIKELLGHANLSATQVYTHNSFENLRNSYNKAHPRAD